MRIDISEKHSIKVIEAIRKLENMDFPEITDGNKMSDLYDITTTLVDYSLALQEEIDY